MSKNEDETLAISDKVEILSTEDEKIKAVGEILSSDPSRKILKLLFNQSLTANQISQKIGVSLPLVIYHLKKMQESDVIKITNVGKNTKSHDMKFYTVDKFAIVILPSEMSKSAKTSKSLFNSFSRIHRLATLGAVCVAAWFSSQFIQKNSQIPITMEEELATSGSEETSMMQKAVPVPESLETSETTTITTGDPSFDILWSLVIVLLVIVAGLIIELVIKNKKRETTKL
ncbi:MAG: ArsR/SmtB family transcription factor [Nitrosopumilaceae archaeon]